MMLAWVTAALLAQASYYTPEEAQALFAQANDAYYREDYAAAEAGYRKLLDRGHGGADVLYNLGTTALKQDKLGEAVLYLERARRAGGAQADLEANLALARSRQLDQVVGAQAEEPFVSRLVAATDERWVGWNFLLAWVLGFALLVLYRLLAPGRRLWVVVAAVLAFAVAVPAGALLTAHVWVRQTLTEAVVLATTAPALEVPRESAKVSFEVHAGLKVRVVEEAGTFVRIRLPNGLEGWVERAGVAFL